MKFRSTGKRRKNIWSRPARGAWVEIPMMDYEARVIFVAPRKGRVG